MNYRFAWLLGSVVVILLLASLGWWWISSAQNDRTPVKQVVQPSPTSDQDTFLPIDLAPGIRLDQILSNTLVIPAGTNMNKVVTIATTGDIIPARGVDLQVRKNGPDYPFLASGIKDLLSTPDITVVDLEAPVLDNCPVHLTGFTFCGRSTFADAMARVGIDVATLENNHITNYGAAGVTETIEHLTAAGIRYASRDHLHIETVKGIKVGFLAFNDIEVRLDKAMMAETIRRARPQVDILMVAVHWGKEYELLPMADGSIAPSDPRELGRAMVDAGADVIIGNHPHWVQGVEIYKDKLISYALGNFIFDQSWSIETQQGLVATYTFYGPKLLGVTYVPIRIINQAQATIATGDEAAAIMDRFKQSTEQLAAL